MTFLKFGNLHLRKGGAITVEITGCASTVITATSISYGKNGKFDPL